MAEDLSPTNRVGEEAPKVRNINGVATSTLLIHGIFEKGPINKPTFCAGPEDFLKQFGGNIQAGVGAKEVDLFFANGGQRLYVNRIAHFTDPSDKSTLTALLAKKIVDDRLVNTGKKAEGSIRVANNAIEPWVRAAGFIEILNNTFDVGDKVTVNGIDFAVNTDFAPGVDTQATALALRNAINASINPAIQGVVQASIDPANNSRVVITAVVYGDAGNSITLAETDGATNNFTVSGATLIDGFDGDVVNVDSNPFRFGDNVVIGPNAAATAQNLATAIGALATVDAAIDPTDNVKVLVTAATVGIAGNSIAMTKVDADNDLVLSGATLTGGQDTDTQDSLLVEAADGEGVHANGRIIRIKSPRNGLATSFRLEVINKAGTTILDAFDNLNLDPVSADYVETRINGKSQKLIKVTDQLSTNTVGNNNLPLLGDHLLAGGDDGLTGLIDLDFIGNRGAKTGMYAAETIEDKYAMAICPDRTTVTVQKAMSAYAEEKKSFKFFYDLPSNLTPQEAVDHVEANGLTSEYASHHYPELVIQDQTPSNLGNEITVPISGAIAGIYARTDNLPGKGVAKTAAGTNDGRIYGIVRLASESTQDKGSRDLLFPAGINPVWSEQGVGVINDGGRLSKLDGLVPNVNERRVFIYCETSIKLGTRWARHENIDEALFNGLNKATTAFLTRFWRQGGLKGKTASEAFYVDTSFGPGTINPPSEEAASRVNMKVGLATKKPGYFIEILFTVDQRALEAELAG